jgi:hypothetical protein
MRVQAGRLEEVLRGLRSRTGRKFTCRAERGDKDHAPQPDPALSGAARLVDRLSISRDAAAPIAAFAVGERRCLLR